MDDKRGQKDVRALVIF